MKKSLILILSIFTLASCVGGGGSSDSGGGGDNPNPGPNPTPAPIPEKGKVTYALIANSGIGKQKIYSAPLDNNGNILWNLGKYTTTDVFWENPYYILVNGNSVYVADAPLASSPSVKNGKIYKCNLTNDGQLIGCGIMVRDIYRPVSMAIQDNNLYFSQSYSGAPITMCNLTTNPVSCKSQDVTKVTGLAPIGVAANTSNVFVTYGCLAFDCLKSDNSLFKYAIQTDGSLTNKQAQKSSSTLSNPTDLTVNNNFLYISNFSTNNVAQYNTELNKEASPVSTIFKGNFEISMNHTNTYAYVINGAPQSQNGYNGYISKCKVKSNGELENSCVTLTNKEVLQQPYGIGITGELEGPSQ